MKARSAPPVTELLVKWSDGDEEAFRRLVPLVQAELRRIAVGYFRGAGAGHTLQPTALVNEAYLRLLGQNPVKWRSRGHFFSIAAGLMRRIFVDHARKRKSQKEGAEMPPVTLSEGPGVKDVDLLALDEALAELEKLDPRQREIVELRFFAGLSQEEIAKALGISRPAIERRWRLARAWLYRRLEPDRFPEPWS